ncbi:MAG: 30S ribosomal protein S17 [Methanotrichaceae archaeon]
MMRDIGLDVKSPEETCDDPKCPFHGTLPVRGQVFDGVVVSDKMTDTVVVLRKFERKNSKYERYEKRRSKIHAHSPPCLNVKMGDVVKVAECRPLSKTKSFVVVEVVR